ncbi:MAG: hypothetical protein O7E57_16240 [Gammaproteobacteria bacterium]|nr:hypothetical protein [Gammaproteobacteria bacterium]
MEAGAFPQLERNPRTILGNRDAFGEAAVITRRLVERSLQVNINRTSAKTPRYDKTLPLKDA